MNNAVGCMVIPSLKDWLHLLLAASLRGLQSRNYFIFLHMMRNLIWKVERFQQHSSGSVVLATCVQTVHPCFPPAAP